jgi:queuine tRNA-ribosyltransferase
VFSLASLRKVEDEGVFFRSHIDGSSHALTPEKVIEVEGTLGSDIMMPLDMCTAPNISRAQAAEAVRRTTEWLRRSVAVWRDLRSPLKGDLFGIMQGNFYKDLREESAAQIAALDLPGYAIGGLSVGEDFPLFQDLLHHSAALLPNGKPKYLMGVGTPEYILEAVEAGIDLFDCVYPTRTARNALVLTSRGPLALRNEKYRLDFTPVDPECDCPTCRRHTRSYLRHLFKAKEIEAAVLATRHNLSFLQRLMHHAREAIARGEFLVFKRSFLSRYREGDQ